PATLIPCIVDADPQECEAVAAAVAEIGYESICTPDPLEAVDLIRRGRCRFFLYDAGMAGTDGYGFLEEALRIDPGVHIVLIAGKYTLNAAVEAVRRGAYDFVPKPIDRVRLRLTLDELSGLYDQRRRVRE